MTLSQDLERRSKLFERVIEQAQHILKTDAIAADARKYIDNRLSREAQQRYQLGYFPSNKNLNSILSLLNNSVLEELMLIYPKFISGGTTYSGHFNNHNLIMPFRDVYGNIIALLGRTLLSSDEQKKLKLQKYKYTYGSNKDLYVFGLNVAKASIIEKGYVIPVEGQFDCITCHENGMTNVVATGWANITKYQFFQLRKYTKNIYPMMDNDEAGIRGRKKIKAHYKNYATIKTLNVPCGVKDIDEALRSLSGDVRKGLVRQFNTIN